MAVPNSVKLALDIQKGKMTSTGKKIAVKKKTTKKK
jgi:hypothetical protein|tara:strand:- start:936 stop:1043 length:108 start_codon:yes stop_codon:yes gene_type:complete